jgi:threonine dehydrogenase-like Zn-dependent dehydrogenase
MVDVVEDCLEIAKHFGATHVINNHDENAVENIMKLTNCRGVDTAIKAVGIPAIFTACEDIVATGKKYHPYNQSNEISFSQPKLFYLKRNETENYFNR